MKVVIVSQKTPMEELMKKLILELLKINLKKMNEEKEEFLIER